MIAMSKRTGSIFAAAAVVFVAWAAMAPALARPPTVGVNPGYDRRLIESRKQQSGSDATAATTPVRHSKHMRHRR
jgi:hypothetical protein